MKKRPPRAKPQAAQFRVAEFALEVGVSEQQVYRLIRQGKLTRDADGFLSLQDAGNRKYYEKHSKPELPVSPSAGPPPAGPPPGESAPDVPRSEIERRKASQQLRKLELANRRASGELIGRPIVTLFVSRLVGTLNSELLSIGQRAAPNICALARSASSDDEGVVAVEGFIEKELYSCLRSVTASTRSFLRDLYGEQPGGAGPVELQAALEEVRGALERTIQEVRESGGAIA
jgi:hypothetical protein